MTPTEIADQDMKVLTEDRGRANLALGIIDSKCPRLSRIMAAHLAADLIRQWRMAEPASYCGLVH